ncbi:DUF998 domain-containing protein [Cohnella cellulosilytica]|uniref:DUF998 domain-containing protein n=1 Tax=Cohnella cellulosilytica TaxID=986710 RepID=A0ABW2FGC7_9BACL
MATPSITDHRAAFEIHPIFRRLAMLAPIGAVLFTIAWLVLGFISPGYKLFDLEISPYSAVSQPISGLGLGMTGPYMNAAFVLGGVLLMLGAAGIANCWPSVTYRGLWRTSVILLPLTGLGMVICGLFTLESVLMHLAGFLLALVIPVVSFILFGILLWKEYGARFLALLLFLAGALTLAFFIIFQIIFDPYSSGENTGMAGLVQRALAVVVLAMFTILGIVGARRTAGD